MGHYLLPHSVMGQTPSTPFETCLGAALPKGAISLPSDPFYDLNAVKRFNTAIESTPVAVVRPSTAQEVSKSVLCAVEHGIKVQARSGGHSYANYCLGGKNGALVVDMVNFQKFEMDRNTWQATIGAGTLLGDVSERLHESGGRAMAHGTCPSVGFGGHATIGGLGPSSRQWGAALDHILEAEVVLANGTIVRTNERQHPEVLWAVKGAAASFGVVTEFVVRTQPEPQEVTQYTFNVNLGSKAKMANTFKAWQKLIADPKLSRKFASQVTIFELGMMIRGTFFGSEKEFKELGFEEKLAVNATSKSIVLDDWLGAVGNWFETEIVKLVGGATGPFYSKSLAFTPQTLIPDAAIDELFQYMDKTDKGTLIWTVIFDLEAGAINDVAPGATAYGHRDTLFYVQTYAFGIGALPQSSRNFLTGINDIITKSLPNQRLGAYAGYVDPALGENGQQAYWGTNLPRLQTIKKAIDPNDVFHNPQSVRPAA